MMVKGLEQMRIYSLNRRTKFNISLPSLQNHSNVAEIHGNTKVTNHLSYRTPYIGGHSPKSRKAWSRRESFPAWPAGNRARTSQTQSYHTSLDDVIFSMVMAPPALTTIPPQSVRGGTGAFPDCDGAAKDEVRINFKLLIRF